MAPMRVGLLALLCPLVLVGCASGGGSPNADAKHEPEAKPKPRPAERHVPPRLPPSPAERLLSLPPIRRGPVPGYVLIADRNNNRLLIVSPSKRIVWRFAGGSAAGGTLRDPDDAFFTPRYRRIVTNEEFNETIAQVDPKTRKIVWSYGRPGVAGSRSGELSNPDDAYVLPNGDVRVADIQNCRVLRLSPSRKIVGEIGTAGACAHDPPRTLLAPNGDTPLQRGGMLVTEIGGYVDRFDAHGKLVYSLRTPGSYPSDAQLLPNGNILVAEFQTPGRVDVINPSGRVVWSYGPSSGPGSLDRPSLAVRWPNGMYAVTDDWHHRVVVIDPRTKRIVWQYGHFGIPSSRRGYLSKPDGLDLLPAGVLARRRGSRSLSRHASLHLERVGVLPEPTSRLAATALPGGRIIAAGGLVGGTSSSQILAGPPAVARLPSGLRYAGVAAYGGTVYVAGGLTVNGESRAVLAVNPSRGRVRRVATLPFPVAHAPLAALDGSLYLIGGTSAAGSPLRTILRIEPKSGEVTRAAVLPRAA